MAAALLLRLYRLGEGLWLDEIYAWVRYMGLPLREIPTVYGSENQHFLFTMLARVSLLLFGESVWAFRLPAVLFGVASLGAVYLFGKEAASEREGLFSAALLTVSYHHIWFSQNARGYTGLLFWTMTTSWLLLRAQREPSIRWWLWYAAAAALGVYTQATIVFLLVGHALIAAVGAARTRAWRGPLAGFGLGALLTVALHAPALPEILKGLQGTVSVVAEWRRPSWTITEMFAGLKIGFYGAAAAVAAASVFAAGCWSYLRSRPVVLTLLLAPAALGTACLLAMGHHIWPRFYFFCFGFAALVAVRGALQVGRAGVWVVAAMILVSAASAPLAYGPKQDFAGAYDFVRAQARPGDAMASADLAAWYFERYRHTGWPTVNTPAELEPVRSRTGRTWLIYTLEPVLQAQRPELYAVVRREFEVVRRFRGTLNNGDVVVCVAGSKP